jgi:phosphatase NudJ
VSKDPIHTWFFALCVVRKGDQYLLVEERKHGNAWYLPGGRVEPGETLMDAAIRETLEESGVPVELEGVLRVEHTPRPERQARVRVVFIARPVDDTPPKSEPDEHTLSARWVSLTQLEELTVRGPDVERYLRFVEGGAAIGPLSMIGFEGDV